MSDARVVLITHPEDGAREFARGLVERRLAACVNLIGAHSVYLWDEKVQSEPEVLMIVKTRATLTIWLNGDLYSGFCVSTK